MQKPLTHYIDGSYLSQTGLGGYPVISTNDHGCVENRKVVREGTDSAMAVGLQAAIEALRHAPTHRAVSIDSDFLTIVDVAARGDIKRYGELKKEVA